MDILSWSDLFFDSVSSSFSFVEVWRHLSSSSIVHPIVSVSQCRPNCSTVKIYAAKFSRSIHSSFTAYTSWAPGFCSASSILALVIMTTALTVSALRLLKMVSSGVKLLRSWRKVDILNITPLLKRWISL